MTTTADDSAALDTHLESPQQHVSHDPYLDGADLARLDAWWRAANYLSVGQIYLMDNPRLEQPLVAEQIKPRLLGHWGTTPGLNFVHAHLNRAIITRELDMIYVFGPGHGGPAAVAAAWLDGRHPLARRAGDPGLDPRGRRAGLCAQPRVPGRRAASLAP